MKKIITLLTILQAFTLFALAEKLVITTGSSEFNPATTYAIEGDTIEFIIESPHTATQVDQRTWSANMSTPLSGGFNFSSGEHQYILTSKDVGTIYYVCISHVAMGMKGIIQVEGSAGIQQVSTAPQLSVVPNLITSNQAISIGLSGVNMMHISVYSIWGAELIKKNIQDSEYTLPITFEPGIYLIRVDDINGNRHTKKIVVK